MYRTHPASLTRCAFGARPGPWPRRMPRRCWLSRWSFGRSGNSSASFDPGLAGGRIQGV